YPGNDEVASFYSLALNGWGTTDRSPVVFEKAATIGLEVLQRNPRHPGALHYVIHAYDNPDHASLALETADKYAIVAPDASHALHMPTHTYLALGLWDKVVSSNEVSWAASRARQERKKLDNDALGYHSYHWLLYGYLQQEHDKKARALIDSMKEFCRVLPSPRARAHLIYLKSTYAAETNDYSNIVGLDIRQNDLNISVRAKEYFVKGMQAFYNKNEEALDNVILQLAGERLVEESKAADKGLRICGNVNPSQVTKSDLKESMVVELELKAMKAGLKKNSALTEKLLKEAVSLQTLNGYSYGPPSVVKPSFEMYGEWLLENNKPKEAIEQFDLSLKLAPNRLLSKKGKAAAQKLLESNPIASR
ncbi:MAG TPA: hypothetical protein VFO70_01840, partial [Chitinophagaceae bacterium]|nr:hypothetical protein [Chitinophagaceae bacterium]